tara:strand:- start:780 stop:947 length:168 start_codon:yes stop_codon:yes gene_type:complete
MPDGVGTYGSTRGRPPMKKNKDEKKKKAKSKGKTDLKGLKVGSKDYMQALRNRKK